MPEEPVVQDAEPEAKPAETTPAAPQAEAKPPEEPDEGEPGGDDPQAVRARKEYRARKRLEKEISERDTRLAAMEAEVRTLKEVRQAPPPAQPQPVAQPAYRPSQVLAAVKAGSVTPEEAQTYIDHHYPDYRGRPIEYVVAAEASADALQRTQQHFATQQITKTASDEVQIYLKHIPALANQSSPEFQQTKEQYQRLVRLGMPDDIRTQVAALNAAFGTLDRLQAAREADVEQRKNAEHPSAGDGTGRRPGTKPKEEEALTGRQRDFYKAKGWNAAADAPYAGIRNVKDLERMKAKK